MWYLGTGHKPILKRIPMNSQTSPSAVKNEFRGGGGGSSSTSSSSGLVQLQQIIRIVVMEIFDW